MKSKTTKLARGVYLYESRGRRYVLHECRTSEGFGCRPSWQVSLVPPDDDPWAYLAAFDQTNTLRDAKEIAEADAEYWSAR